VVALCVFGASLSPLSFLLYRPFLLGGVGTVALANAPIAIFGAVPFCFWLGLLRLSRVPWPRALGEVIGGYAAMVVLVRVLYGALSFALRPISPFARYIVQLDGAVSYLLTPQGFVINFLLAPILGGLIGVGFGVLFVRWQEVRRWPCRRNIWGEIGIVVGAVAAAALLNDAIDLLVPLSMHISQGGVFLLFLKGELLDVGIVIAGAWVTFAILRGQGARAAAPAPYRA
jgi:hypothetical protein